jgi:hypothetical protein
MRAFFFGGTMTEFKPYESAAEIEEVVRRFESCGYQPEEFVHARHLTVSAWYFLHFDAETAKERMRSGLQQFIRHHGKSGYHVTMTEFWLQVVEEVLHAIPEGDGALASVNQAVERLNDKVLIYEYFSRERLDSVEAKAGLIPPDRKPLAGARDRATEGRILNLRRARP